MRSLVACLVAVPLVLAACGGGGDGGDDAPTADQAFMDTSRPRLSDAQYVAALCDGIEGWVDAVNTKGSPGELREARDELEAATRSLHPPEGAEDFQRDYVEYLEAAEDEPTLLVTREPPLPAGDLRARLAAAEAGASCEYPLFTRGGDPSSPTPGG